MDREKLMIGVRQAMPLAVSVFGYGIAWGALARQGGFSLGEIVLMSTVVFAGASQFVAVGMLGAGAGSGEIVLATLLLNLRHLLMGASLGPYFRHLRLWQLAGLAHCIVDESFALAMEFFRKVGGSASYFLGVGLAFFAAWGLSSLLGGVVGSGSFDPKVYGLDFAFVGAFIGLLVPQLKGRPAWIAFAVASVVALAASDLLPGKWFILLAAVAAAAAGAGVTKNAA